MEGGTHTCYGKRTTALDFQGQGSKLKVTCTLNIVKACKQDKDRVAWIRTVKLGTHTSYGKGDFNCFQGQVPKVKVTLNIVLKPCKQEKDRIVWPFGLGLQNLVHVHLLVMARRTHCISMSGVRGQVHTLRIAVWPCKQDKDRIVWVRTVKLGTHTFYGMRSTPISFQGQVSKVKVMPKIFLKPR